MLDAGVRFTPTIREDVFKVAARLGFDMYSPAGCDQLLLDYDQLLLDYALLVFATYTPIDRALTYLEDTGSPAHATGRLLLRAAERALRANGDMPEVAYGTEAEVDPRADWER